MKYKIVTSRQYKKDYRKMVKSGKDIKRLIQVTDILASGKKLDSNYKDHPLKGHLKGKRECHIGPDWLLLYEKDKANLILILMRTGDHRHFLGIE